ncbi:hypothetical protein [uncultured Shewanella sp.]|uniref:hypothetical protein n=1 Tax=uncultured Shewanella sp. TaxID=173975 RepID=UPI00262CC599|nr:hypothetical protein [uncultured Shewanella sp.]
MDNLFEQAVSRSETVNFFKGEGQYYSHNPMDGGHCYGIRLSENLAQYLNSDKHNLYIFNEVFNHFISSLSSSEADLRHLLSNVFEINRLKNNGVVRQGNPIVKGTNTQGVGHGFSPNRRDPSSPVFNEKLDNWVVRFDSNTGKPFMADPTK